MYADNVYNRCNPSYMILTFRNVDFEFLANSNIVIFCELTLMVFV